MSVTRRFYDELNDKEIIDNTNELSSSAAVSIDTDTQQQYLYRVKHNQYIDYINSPLHSTTNNTITTNQTNTNEDTSHQLLIDSTLTSDNEVAHNDSLLHTLLHTYRVQMSILNWYSVLVISGIVCLLCAGLIGFEIGRFKYFSNIINNNTSIHQRNVIVVSLDGFRGDYLSTYADIIPNLKYLQSTGISSEYMISAFPSITFPNHYTLATGLNPESHGIVANHFYDPHIHQSFTYGSENQNNEYWWSSGEPIWISSERWGIHAGVSMWPGSDVQNHNITATHIVQYDGTDGSSHVKDLLSWLMPDNGIKINLAMIYMSMVDSAGHAYGLNTTQLSAAIQSADNAIGNLINGLKHNNIYDQSDIIIVSDHGMTESSIDGVTEFIYLDDYVSNIDTIVDLEKSTFGTIALIRVLNDNDINAVYQQLQSAPHMTVWLRDDVPLHYRYRTNDRIAPIVILMNEGYISDLHQFPYRQLGTHGYDPELQSMRAVFIASGTTFANNIKLSSDELIHTRDIYNLLCTLLHISPAPNNGTIDTLIPYINKW